MSLIEFPLEDLVNLLNSAKGVAQVALELMVPDLLANIIKGTPVDHGRLQGAWDFDIGDLTARLFNNVEYALAVHDGAKAHWIEAKNAKALGPIPMSGTYMGVTFKGTGFFKRVWHPGYVGNPFTEPAIEASEGRLDEFVQTALDQTVAS